MSFFCATHNHVKQSVIITDAYYFSVNALYFDIKCFNVKKLFIDSRKLFRAYVCYILSFRL